MVINGDLIFFRCPGKPFYRYMMKERNEKEDERVLSVVVSNGLMSSLHNVKLCSGWSLGTAARVSN